jgi:putative ABC transport system ATP-binding protein
MIQLDDVRKTYRSRRGVTPALRGVSLSVGQGESLALVGKSGSGKTTLLHCTAGIERPDGGRVHCCGVALHTLAQRALGRFLREQVGIVFQRGNLLSYLTAAENVAFPLQLNGWTARERARRVAELLERIGLGEAGGALPDELSGGELQRVALARAIAHRPRLLLADEPTASLDTATGARLVGLMLGLAREGGCTVVVATHDPDVVSLADRRVELLDGRIQDEA